MDITIIYRENKAFLESYSYFPRSMIHQLLRLRDVHTQHVYSPSINAHIHSYLYVCVCVNAKVSAKFDFLFWGKSPSQPLFTLHLADIRYLIPSTRRLSIGHWRHTSRLFKRWAGLHGFSDLYLEHGCGMPMQHSTAPPGKYKNNFWTGSSLMFQTILNERISNTKQLWREKTQNKVLETSRKWVFRGQHEWVFILSKLTRQAKFYGNSTTKLLVPKTWRFSACQRHWKNPPRKSLNFALKKPHLGIASFAENIFQRMRKTLHHGLPMEKSSPNYIPTHSVHGLFSYSYLKD